MTSRSVVKTFGYWFTLAFVMTTLVMVVPEIINFCTGWNPPVPDKDKLLRWGWIIPLISALFASAMSAAEKLSRLKR